MILNKDFYDNIEVPSYVLCKINGERIGEIPCTEKKLSINELNEITLTTYKKNDEVDNEVYDLISEMKMIIIPGKFRFIISEVDEEDDGVNPKKSVTAKSLETILGQKYLEEFYINNGEDYGMNGVRLYDANNKTISLLNLVLDEKCPDWSIGYVDPELAKKERYFECERTDIYSFLTGEVAEAFEATIIFDSWRKTVSVYKESEYGRDTNIFLTFDNLLQNVQLSSSVDEIKTCMTVIGAEDLNLREVNMGSDRIYNFDYYVTPEFMSNDTCHAYALWKQKMETNRDAYNDLVNQSIALYHDINYLMNEKMPKGGDNLITSFPSYSGTINGVTIASQTSGVPSGSIGLKGTANALTEYIICENLNDYLEEDEIYSFCGCPSLDDESENPAKGDIYMQWYNKDIPQSKDEGSSKDTGDGNTKRYQAGYNRLSIFVKNGTTISDVEGQFDPELYFTPNIYKAGTTSTDWTKYGLNPLKEELSKREQQQSVMIKAGQGDPEHRDYQTKYLPLYNEINAIKEQITVVELQLSALNTQLQAVHASMDAIVVDVAMKNNFTTEQLNELLMFVREESINSDNYVITDSMTDEERVKMLQDMLEYGETELAKVSQPQIQFSTSLVNLFNLKEFDDISVDFERGNYVHVILRDDYVVKARLLSFDIDFYDLASLSVTFGNLNKTKEKTLFTDITKAINTASSVSTTVSVKGSYWNAANKDINDVNSMLEDGLVAAGQTIKTSTADVNIDNRGILLASTDAEYPNDRVLIGGSRILFSDDDLRTVKQAVGRCKYTDKNGVVHDEFGTIAQFMIAGYINGSTIDGGTINVGGTDNGAIIMYDQNGVEKGRWDVTGLTLPPGTKIQWTDVEEAPTIPENTSDLNNDSNFITDADLPTNVSQLNNDANYQNPEQIRSTVITKDYIESLNIVAGSIDAENIKGNSIKGRNIKLILDSCSPTFDEVYPIGNENPNSQGWYEYNETQDEYFLTQDTTVNSSKTYYKQDDTSGLSLTARHIFGTSPYDAQQLQFTNQGISSLVRKNVNTDATPSTQNDYLFQYVNMGKATNSTISNAIFGTSRHGYIEKQYEYIDNPTDTFEDRCKKSNIELSHIVYTDAPKNWFIISYEAGIRTYDDLTNNFAFLMQDFVGYNKNNHTYYASVSPNPMGFDYGSSSIASGDSVTIPLNNTIRGDSDSYYGYKVFITNTSAATTTYVEKNSDNFVVHGENGATFDYQVVYKIL